MNANLLVHIQFPVHLLYATLHTAYQVLCFGRSAFVHCCAARSARRSVSCLLVLMRKNFGLKGFLTFWQMHPVDFLLFSIFFSWPLVCISSWLCQCTLTDWQPKLRPFTELWMIAFEHLIDVLFFYGHWSVLCFLSLLPMLFFYCCISPYDILYLFVYSNDFSRMVAEEYLSFFNFTGLVIDQALRWEHTVQEIQYSHGWIFIIYLINFNIFTVYRLFRCNEDKLPACLSHKIFWNCSILNVYQANSQPLSGSCWIFQKLLLLLLL